MVGALQPANFPCRYFSVASVSRFSLLPLPCLLLAPPHPRRPANPVPRSTRSTPSSTRPAKATKWRCSSRAKATFRAPQITLTQSLDQLKAAAARCGSTPGCDSQRFYSVFDRLLRLKDGDFGGDQDLDSDIDPTQAALPTGKTGAASLPEAQRSVTLLHGQKLSELIAMNGAGQGGAGNVADAVAPGADGCLR